MFPPPKAIVEPADSLSFTNLRTFSDILVIESGPPKALPVIASVFTLAIEFVISFPAPKIKEPLELLVLLAVPTTALAKPDTLLLDVADSIEFKEPVIVAPKFLVAFVASFPS